MAREEEHSYHLSAQSLKQPSMCTAKIWKHKQHTMHTRTHTHAHTHTHTHTLTHTHTHTHTHKHTKTQKHTNTHTHIYTRIQTHARNTCSRCISDTFVSLFRLIRHTRASLSTMQWCQCRHGNSHNFSFLTLLRVKWFYPTWSDFSACVFFLPLLIPVPCVVYRWRGRQRRSALQQRWVFRNCGAFCVPCAFAYRASQNHICTSFLTGKSPNIRSYMMHICGCGWPCSYMNKRAGPSANSPYIRPALMHNPHRTCRSSRLTRMP